MMVSRATTAHGHTAPGASRPDPAAARAAGPRPHGRRLTGLVIDDHGIARRGVLSLARETFPGSSTWTGVGTGAEALGLVRDLQPEMVLMDVRTPEAPSGPALVAQLLAIAPAANVVVLVAGAPGGDLERCLAAGASGAVWKGSPEDEIASVLRQVDAGSHVVDTQITTLLRELRDERRRAPVSLTDRERSVLALLAEGCSNREIGERLVLSPATIKDHVRHLLRKLEASSRLQALVKAAEAGLLQVGPDRIG